MDLDEIFFPKDEDESQARQDEMQKIIKNLEIYKKTMSLLKTKMIKSDVLISQYNDKIKKCDLLNEELSVAKSEKQDVLNKYNLALEKVTRLELTNVDYKQSIEKYKKLSEVQKLKLDENEKLISQYNFKIKNLEEGNSILEDNIKTQQENIKDFKSKYSEKKQTKQKGCQTTRVEKLDSSTNTNPLSLEPKKPLMYDKEIMTDEILRTEPFPIFCTKCENLCDPAPIDQILKIMSSQPPLLSEHITPPNSPEPFEKKSDNQELFEYDNFQKIEKSIVEPLSSDEESKQLEQNFKQCSFMEIDKLVRRIDKIESLMKKKKSKTKLNDHMKNECCATKNIKFVVRVPNQTKLYEYRKREKHKIKKLNRLKRKQFKIDKCSRFNENNWTIEHCSESESEKNISQTKKNITLKQKKFKNCKKVIDELFESSQHSIPGEKIRNTNDSSSNKSLSSHKSMSPSHEIVSPSSKISSSSLLSDLSSRNLDLRKKLVVESTNLEDGTIKHASAFCSSLSSQISEPIYKNIVQEDTDKKSINNPSSINNLSINNMPIFIINNEESENVFLPNDLVIQKDDLLPTKVCEDKIYQNETVFVEHQQMGNKNLQEDITIKESVNSISESIQKPENNSLDMLIQHQEHTRNSEKCNQFIVSSSDLISNEDSTQHLSNNDSRIDSEIFRDVRHSSSTPFESIDEDKPRDNLCIEEVRKRTSENITAKPIILDNTEICSKNTNDTKNVEIQSGSYPINSELSNSSSGCSANKILHEYTLNGKTMLSEIGKDTEKFSETDSVNNEVLKCLSPRRANESYTQILDEKTVLVDKQIDCNTDDKQENLLNVLMKTTDKESCENKLALYDENQVNEEVVTIYENISLIESTSTEKCETINVKQSSLPITSKGEHIDVQEKPEEIILSTDFQSSHHLPILPNIVGQSTKLSTLTVAKPEESVLFTKTSSPINNVPSSHNNLSPALNSIEKKSMENINENSSSSDMSSEITFFSASGIKLGENINQKNIIVSEESSEENSIDTKKRKNLSFERGDSPITRKKLLTKIKKFKEMCENPSKFITTMSASLEVKRESVSPLKRPIESSTRNVPDTELLSQYEPPKKQRIAHTPKSIEHDVHRNNIGQTPKILKKTKLVKKPNATAGDNISELLEVFDKTCKERKNITQNLKQPLPPPSPDKSLRDLLGDNPDYELIQNHSNLPKNTPMQKATKKRGRPPKIAGKKSTNINTTQKWIDLDSPILESTVENDNIDFTIRTQESNICEHSENVISDISTCESNVRNVDSDNATPDLNGKGIEKSKSKDVDCTQSSLIETTTSCNDITENEIPKEPKKRVRKKTIVVDTCQNQTPMRELRSRQVNLISQESPKVINRITARNTKILPKLFPKQIDDTNSSLNNSVIISLLNKYLSIPQFMNTIRKTRIDFESLRENETVCYEQLDLLMHSEEWTTEINSQVMEELLSSQELKTIALFMIEYAVDKFDENEVLDKCNTPPAPMMPRSEQKLITLIHSISEIHPEFDDIIEKGIQYKLFRLAPAQSVQIVERLFRILVVLNKIKKDREKVRMLCCDALYCLHLRAMNIIYVALTCWPEIFPKHDSNNDIIVKTIVHIVMILQVNNPYPKLNSLRKLLSTYYEYPDSGYITNDFRVEIMNNLQKNAPGINTAVLLLCKKLGPNWALDNVINGGLKKMIVDRNHPCLYEALILLGNILRAFPANDLNNSVCENIDQLCYLLDNKIESDDLQEGIVACLLSISKFKYEQIARSVIKWQFDKELRSATKEKLNSFFKQQNAKWWMKFVQTNYPLRLED